MLLERHTVLEDRNLMDTGLLVVGVFARGHTQNLLGEFLDDLIHVLVFSQHSGIEVDPCRLTLVKAGVGRDLHCGDEGAEWRSTTGGEEDELATGSSQSGRGHKVIAGGGEEVETIGLQALAILHDATDYRFARLLGTAKCFLLEGGDTAGLITWRGILANGLTMGEEVVLEVVDHRDGVLKKAFIGTTFHEDRLCTEHLGHFGKDCGATFLLTEVVGESAKERIGSDAGEAIRATTLQADAEFAGGYGDALVLLSLANQLFEEFDTIGNLVALHFLTDHELNAILVVFATELFEEARLVVLATQSDDENGSGIGVVNHIAKNLAGILMIFAEL